MVSNRPIIFQLRQALASLKQDQSTVDAYFAKLKVIWDELSNYRPACHCGASSRLCNEEHVMVFLMGLNESFAHIRDQILKMDPLPTMREVFSLVVQEEKQMSIADSGSLAFAARDELENVVNGATMKINEEEGDSEIHVPDVKVKNGRSHPYHLRRCKSLNLLESNINSLPDEIVFDILVLVPAEDIYSAVRTVCRKWYQMIHTNKFRNTHLHHSTYGLLVQKRVSQSTSLTFISLSRQGQINLTRLNYRPEHSLWCSSCNGLMLEGECRKDDPLYIANPVTMQRFSLPRPDYRLACLGFGFPAIAFASLSMEYKVVRVCYTSIERWDFIILIVGADKSWRPICTQHLSSEVNFNLHFEPLTTEGFVHWAINSKYVLTLKVETEIITEYRVPSSSNEDRVYYFATVKCLSMLIGRGGWSWEVWEMTPETGEWTQLPGIDLEDRMCDIFGRIRERYKPFRSFTFIDRCLLPVGWLEYKEVFLYRLCCPRTTQQLSICMAWNIRLKELEFIEVDPSLKGFSFHRNSLLWLDGC